MINVYLRLLDFMDGTPVSSADVYVTLRVTPILRPGSVNVPTILPPILPPTLQDDSFVERPPSAADDTTLADGQDDVFVERRTSAADGTLGCSFDVSNEAFQGAFERQSVRIRSLKDGDLYEVGAGLGVDVACAGLQRSFHLTWLPRLHEPADVRQDIAVDFAKAIVGHTTWEKALLWFSWHGTARAGDRYFCEVESLATPDQRRSFPVEFGDPDPAQTVIVPVDALRPATKYRYLLRLLEAGAGPDDSGRTLASGEFTTAPEPASSDRLSFVFGSCHFPAISVNVERREALDRWEDLARRRDYDLMLLVGDQMYGDDIEHLGNDWFERYANRYHQMWAYRPMCEVLRRTPTYMIFDDHEVADDWGSDPDFSRLEPGREDRALDAYRAFQHSHNPGGRDPTGPFYYSFRWGPAAFFVSDCRSQRRISVSHPMLGDDQFRALQHWARNEARQADVIFFVATVPMAFLPVEEVRGLIKELEKKGEALKGAGIGFFLAGPLGAAAGHYIGPRIAGKKLARQDHARLTELDLADMWTYEPNQRELAQVLELLFDLANDVVNGGKQPRAVFTLGGDVHLGAMHVIASSFQKHRKNPFIYQLISSPISNRPIDNTVLLNAARHIQEGKNISHLDLLAAARDRNKWAEGFFDKNPARFSLHNAIGNSFVTQVWELLAERNFGRISFARARKNRRAYQFSLSIEGQSGSLRREMELDLDADGPIGPSPVSSHVVHGAIRDKWAELGGEQGFLGYPLTDETATPDGVGRFNHFEGGSIYWTPNTGAHEVHGAIRDKWTELDWERGLLGYPLTDETTTPDGVGRFNHFQHGSIYWTPDTGAHEVHGAIRDKWAELGWEPGFLGYPLTDEATTPDGVGRYNHFQGGSIYWTAGTGAHEVHGAIWGKWTELGWERSSLGYPITDELTTPDGLGRFNDFQHGSIYWTPDGGPKVIERP